MPFTVLMNGPLDDEVLHPVPIEKNSLVSKFESIDWAGMLGKDDPGDEYDDVYYTASLEITNDETAQYMDIHAFGNQHQYEFYITYLRPKKVKTFFGLKEKMDESYGTELTGQTRQDVIDCLQALSKNDTNFLEKKFV